MAANGSWSGRMWTPRRLRVWSRRCPAIIPVPSGVRVWLATGHTDMRKGFDGLALMVQETLKRDPHGGHLFFFSMSPRRSHQMSMARWPGEACSPKGSNEVGFYSRRWLKGP